MGINKKTMDIINLHWKKLIKLRCRPLMICGGCSEDESKMGLFVLRGCLLRSIFPGEHGEGHLFFPGCLWNYYFPLNKPIKKLSNIFSSQENFSGFIFSWRGPFGIYFFLGNAFWYLFFLGKAFWDLFFSRRRASKIYFFLISSAPPPQIINGRPLSVPRSRVKVKGQKGQTHKVNVKVWKLEDHCV